MSEQTGSTTVPAGAVGRYRLVRRLGTGSFATVWLGHDDDLDVPVAVKILAEEWADNTDVRQRFLTEARLMRRIRDERITHVYDIGRLPDGRPYFVMDYADGGSLNDLRRVRPSPVRALRLCAEACRAIEVLHEHDVVHRDVTPGNVLLSSSHGQRTRIMIADLGVARDLAVTMGMPMTAGTPGFMSPEQAHGVEFDHRADVYALAALCYAMLSGHPPFGVRTLDDVLNRDPASVPEPIAASVGAREGLDDILTAALRSDPDQRPPTAGLLGEALDRIADDLERDRRRRGARAATYVASVESDEDSTHAGTAEAAGAGADAGADADESGDESMATMIRMLPTAAPPSDEVVRAESAHLDPFPRPVSHYVLLTLLGLVLYSLITLGLLAALR